MWAHRGCWMVSGKVISTLSLRNLECRKRGGWNRSGSLIIVLLKGEENSVWDKMCNVLLSVFQGGTCVCHKRLDFNCAYKWTDNNQNWRQSGGVEVRSVWCINIRHIYPVGRRRMLIRFIPPCVTTVQMQPLLWNAINTNLCWLDTHKRLSCGRKWGVATELCPVKVRVRVSIPVHSYYPCVYWWWWSLNQATGTEIRGRRLTLNFSSSTKVHRGFAWLLGNFQQYLVCGATVTSYRPPVLPFPGDVPTSHVITRHCFKPSSSNNIYPYQTWLSWVWGNLDLSTYEKLKNDSNIMNLKGKELAVCFYVVEITGLDQSSLFIVKGPLSPPHSCLRRKLVLIVRWVYLRLKCWTAHTRQSSCCRHKHISRCLGSVPKKWGYGLISFLVESLSLFWNLRVMPVSSEDKGQLDSH